MVTTLLAVLTLPIQTGMVPFVIPWDDATPGTATDVSFLNAMPAGKNGWIRARDGKFIEERTGKRVRFYATNMGALAAFPLKKDADKIAARLAKHGINLVRFHHLQNNWDTEGGMIWKKDRIYLEFDPVQVDKLDYFIAALKKKGIYSNINLQTTRNYLPEMGLPESVTQWKQNFGKKLDKIWPRMITLQQEYARDLLDRKNPYTGLKYKDDPAILKLEINNENSMVGWPGESPGAGLDGLPEPFRGFLVQKWNAWLAKKYPSTDSLQAAWSKGSTPLGENLITNPSWTSENQSNADVTFTPTGGQMEADIRNTKGPDWHIQVHLPGLDVKEGQTYTLQFEAKASVPRGMGITVNLDRPDWRNVGLSASAQMGSEFRSYTYSLTARNVDPKHVRVAFVLGASTGQVTIRNVTLRPGRISPNLKPGESLAKANIDLPFASMTPQGIDYATFLTEMETEYSNAMRKFLRQELGFRNALIIDTQIAWGGASAFIRERDMDYADNHAYWQHPTFVGTDWDPKNWFVNRQAMVNEMDGSGGELGNLARTRVAGRPYSISEYDHPAPNDYMAEMIPLFSTVGAAQDWDALYTFSYDATGEGRPNSQIQGFFSQGTNPAKFGFSPAAALIFRNMQVPRLPVSSNLVIPANPLPFGFQIWDLWEGRQPNVLKARMGVRVGNVPAPQVRQTGDGRGEFRVRGASGRKVFTADYPAAKSIVGFTRGNAIGVEDLSVLYPTSGPDFSSMTLTPLDGQTVLASRRMLLTAVGRVENQGMGWNQARTSVSDQWGRGPTLIEVIPMEITLQGRGTRKVFELDGRGRRVRPVPVRNQGSSIRFGTRGSRTMFWEIVG